MKNIQMTSTGDLYYQVSENEYNASENKEQFHTEMLESNQGSTSFHYKTITDEKEKNTILNYEIYELLKKIKNIGLFFVILTIINLIASVILALRWLALCSF